MSWRNTGGSGFMNLKDRRWGFPLPTRGLPTFGLSSSYRAGKNEASANGCYMKQFSGFGSRAPGSFG